MKMSVTSGYSARANPGRGYHDYEMHIEFLPEEGTTLMKEAREKYVTMFFDHLRSSNFYMWVNTPQLVEERTKEGTEWIEFSHYVINYGYDSGD